MEQESLSPWVHQFLQRMGVLVPRLNATERMRRRLAQRNERSLYKRICDLCQKTIIALHPADAPFPVYCSACWWSDNWDPMQYGQDFDFNRPFFEQMHELRTRVPHLGILTRNSQNSDYTNYEEESKNCYLTFAGGYSEDCMYSHFCLYSKDCMDCSTVRHCELCYEGVNLDRCYHCLYLRESQGCNDCILGSDLQSCSNCFGCVGLRNKEYHIFNEPVSKEEYERQLPELLNNVKSPEVQSRFQELYLQVPVRYARVLLSENCTGDSILESENCQNCFEIKKAKDAYDITWGEDFTDAYDSNVVYIGCQLVYNSHSICLQCTQVRMSNFSWNVSFCDYSDHCFYSNNIFGCVGVKHKNYCILNKAYSETEYKALTSRIIEHMKQTGEWGEFFPDSFFAYNETQAQEYLPLSKEEALAHGYRWKEEPVMENRADALQCSSCKKFFRTIPQELEFYKRMSLEVPTRCFDCRHRARFQLKIPWRLWDRNCMNCGVALRSTFAPTRPEKVFCEECYLKVVY